ncbi:hypothetical protein PoB_004508200 [Plakobranchus ocellatus]|uniref:Uncharacterized protein n=1 Tax=Plakobranchus ocellatus TaxID=259542 RepID=A0AAV4BGR3_9GAST|nr:hypothetical protein PoB_004508200 [Plakobranchus ocellatus]
MSVSDLAPQEEVLGGYEPNPSYMGVKLSTTHANWCNIGNGNSAREYVGWNMVTIRIVEKSITREYNDDLTYSAEVRYLSGPGHRLGCLSKAGDLRLLGLPSGQDAGWVSLSKAGDLRVLGRSSGQDTGWVSLSKANDLRLLSLPSGQDAGGVSLSKADDLWL